MMSDNCGRLSSEGCFLVELPLYYEFRQFIHWSALYQSICFI